MSDDPVRLRFSDSGGWGDPYARHEGRVVFGPTLIVGEEALVRIERRRRDFPAARVLELVKRSPHRVEPRCPLFGHCSGCQWQHVAYPYQLELKREIVRYQLARVGKLEDVAVEPTIGAEDPWHYRNHGRFTVEGGRAGFVRQDTREFFHVPTCHIMHPRINEVLATVAEHGLEVTQCNVRVGTRTGEEMIQPRLQPDCGLDSGQSHYVEELMGRRFRVSAPAFFQVNSVQAERLVEEVIRGLAPEPGDVVVDAYAGVGVFAVLLAPRVAKVIAIEMSGPAMDDARLNAAGLDNVELREGATEALLGRLEQDLDGVILDPPRTGCKRGTIRGVLRQRPRRVVYVSCNPVTLARDLGKLCRPARGGPGYRIERVQPVDMFPHTRHVEVVATLVAEPA